jgi:hypothetical protein
MRDHVASGLTDRELERARRQLAASLALSRPGSPIHAPIQAQLTAIDTALADRAHHDPTVAPWAGAPVPSPPATTSGWPAISSNNPGHYEADSYGNWEPEPQP